MTSPASFPQHTISMEIGGKWIDGWSTYEITTSMLEPVARFHVSMPFTREVWDLCVPDSPFRLLIDAVVVIKGLIDERLVPEDGDVVEIIGRNMVGRLVDESCPSFSFVGLETFDLIKRAADPWFTNITFSNARNRRVLRGRGKKAKASGEPVKLTTGKRIGERIEPGQTRWHIIESVIQQSGYVAFASGDGSELIVGKPNYDQEVQFKFFMPMNGSKRISEATVLGMGVRHAVTERYSRVVVVGSGVGTDANYGASVASRYGQAKNNPATLDGDGKDFQFPKRLIAVRSVASLQEAGELAQREMDRRDAHAYMVTVLAGGHGQVLAGQQPTLFAPDTLAELEDERTGISGTFLIVGCSYRCHREQGEQTSITLVRSGSELCAA